MKRGCSSSSSGDMLTGGTGDVNPQVLMVGQDLTFTNASGNFYNIAQIPNPAWDINRSLSASTCKNAKAFVLEVLKVTFNNDIGGGIAASVGVIQVISGISLVQGNSIPPGAGTNYNAFFRFILQQMGSTSPEIQNNSNVIAFNIEELDRTDNVGTATRGPSSYEIDCTDGAGHGIIVGTQYLYLLAALRFSAAPGVSGSGWPAAKILYRYKGIPYDEFIRQYTFGI